MAVLGLNIHIEADRLSLVRLWIDAGDSVINVDDHIGRILGLCRRQSP